jgi:hypothetical protein
MRSYYDYMRVDRAGVLIEEVTDFIPNSAGTGKCLACNPVDDTLFITCGSNETANVWVGKMGETPTLKTLPLSWTAYAAIGTSTGRVLFFSKSGYCYTDDNGQSFSAEITIPAGGIEYTTRVATTVIRDEINGYIYILAGRELLVSTNNGDSFIQMFYTPLAMSSVDAHGDVILVKEHQRNGMISYIHVSIDAGKTFAKQLISEVGENITYDYKMMAAITKQGVAISTNRGLEILDGSGELVIIGGMPIAIMEELN